MSKKSRPPQESLTQALRNAFTLRDELDAAQPWIHINCRGRVEIENCGRVLEYGPTRIRLQLMDNTVTLEGEEMTICSLNAHITEIQGGIFRLSIGEAPP